MVVRKVFPGGAVPAVVLADRPPLPLAEVRTPPLPVHLALFGLLQPLFFTGHRKSWTLLGSCHRGVALPRPSKPVLRNPGSGIYIFGVPPNVVKLSAANVVVLLRLCVAAVGARADR